MKIPHTKNFSEYKQLVIKDKRSNKLNFEPDGREHYVYRVTDIEIPEYYYGSHTPSFNKQYETLEEEFWTYRTSSRKRKILKEDRDIKYKVKIIKVFNNPADKTIYEAFLHQYFNVKLHDKFWNRSNQTPFKFDTTGTKRSEESKQNQIKAVTGKKQSKEHIEKRMVAHIGATRSEETKKKISKLHKGKKLSEEHKLILLEYSKNQVHTEERKNKQSDKMMGEGNPMYGRTHTEENKLKMSHKGENNGSTYIIHIFNKDGFVEEINSYYFLRHELYPICALKKCMKLNKTIGTSEENIKVLKDKEKWEGWYAVKIQK